MVECFFGPMFLAKGNQTNHLYFFIKLYKPVMILQVYVSVFGQLQFDFAERETPEKTAEVREEDKDVDEEVTTTGDVGRM